MDLARLGPTSTRRPYSERHGGYDRMVSRHLGKGLREEQRARWVELLCKSADDAKLPTDPEWRARVRLLPGVGLADRARERATGSAPAPQMPVPRWWWVCDATPGSRVSALPDEEPDDSIKLPGRDEPVSFEPHIRPLFREVDRRSMSFAFDLWSHDDVAAHADAILERLQAGTMPCDAAWPADRLEVFRRWVESGTPV